ncbi:hypothetical protein FB446DRAFT_718586 [Lentinula raphanica]|uniref:HMG box domain-containing protein n=1 Tax=Lentinula raphanica TaxID=153919 RepID=A0AA38UCA9_9AGAR|nr:hypothetical protein FB446DRAFT_718586 [Lentinula raphanica]KAJ3837027.1 hypothetical protein F5878DRAFT_623576 [Lentinula raphanica]
MISFLSARSSALRLAVSLTRSSVAPVFSRPATASLRTFLTAAPLQSPAAKAKSQARPKAAVKSKSKSTTAKSTTAKKTPVKKGKRVKKADAKPKFDRKLMVPPKRHGTTPYLVYLKEYMSDAPKDQVAVRELVRAASRGWSNLSDAEKQPYSVPVQANKEDYERRYEEWFRSLPPGYLRQINIKRKEKGKYIIRKPKSMKSPPHNGFIYFSSEYREANSGKNLSMPQIAKDAGAAWKSLSESEREKYNNRAREIKDNFMKTQSAA